MLLGQQIEFDPRSRAVDDSIGHDAQPHGCDHYWGYRGPCLPRSVPIRRNFFALRQIGAGRCAIP